MNRKAAKVICTAVITLTTLVYPNVSNAQTKDYKLSIQEVVRLSGQDRFETAVKVSKHGWQNGSDTVVLARGDEFPDALCASTLAKKYDAPILLTSKEKLNDVTLNEIKRLKAKSVYIVGREGAISEDVENEIKKLGINVQRIGGRDRFETSLEIAKIVGIKKEVALATGLNYADALSFSSIAANKNIPILLVNKNYIPKDIKQILNNPDIKKIYVIGGEGVISENALKGLNNIERIAGQDRYETNTKIMEYFSADINKDSIFAAIGGPGEKDFADALTASAYAGKKSSFVAITQKYGNEKVEKAVKQKIKPSTRIYSVGGQAVLTNKAIDGFKVPAIVDGGSNYVIGDLESRNKINNNVLIKYQNSKIVNTDISGNVYVDGNKVELRDLKVDGDIYVDPGKDGITHIVNVEARSIKILSGAKESIHIVNVKADNVEIEAKESVRLVSEGNTNITKTLVKTSAIVEANEGNLGIVEISKSTASNKEVELRGTIDTVLVKEEVKLKSNGEVGNLKIQKEDADIKLAGNFKNVEVENKARIELDKETKIENVTLKAETEVVADKQASISNLNIATKDEKAQIKIQAIVDKVVVESKLDKLEIKEGSAIKELEAKENVTINKDNNVNIEKVSAKDGVKVNQEITNNTTNSTVNDTTNNTTSSTTNSTVNNTTNNTTSSTTNSTVSNTTNNTTSSTTNNTVNNTTNNSTRRTVISVERIDDIKVPNAIDNSCIILPNTATVKLSDGSIVNVKVKNWLINNQGSTEQLEYLGELDLSQVNNVELTNLKAKVNVIKKDDDGFKTYFKQVSGEFDFNNIIFNESEWIKFDEESSGILKGQAVILILDKNNRVVAGIKYIKDNIEITSGTFGDLNRQTIVDGTFSINVKEGNEVKLSNLLINGDVVVDGGGDVTLYKTNITGNLLIKDIATSTLNIKDTNISNIKMKDANGGRIKVENSSIGEFIADENSETVLEINTNSKVDSLYIKSEKLNMKGDFDKLVEQVNFIERGDRIDLSKIKIDSNENKTIKDIRNKVNTKDKMLEKLEKINEIYTSPNGVEEYNQWIENGRRFKVLLEDAGELGYIQLGDFKEYSDVEKIIVANSIRAAKWGNFAGKFNSMEDIQKALDDAVQGMYVERECRKFVGWGNNFIYDGKEAYVSISSELAVGSDITENVLKIKEGEKLDDGTHIKPIIIPDFSQDENEFVQVFKEKAFLLKKNNYDEYGNLMNSVPVFIETSKGGSYTGINVKVEKDESSTSSAIVLKTEINSLKDSNTSFKVFTQNTKKVNLEIYELNEDLQLGEKTKEENNINVTEQAIELNLNGFEDGKDYAIKVIAFDSEDRTSEYIKRFTYNAPIDAKIVINNDNNNIDIDSSNAVYHNYSFFKYKRVEAKLIDKNSNKEVFLSNGMRIELKSIFAPNGEEVVNRIECNSIIDESNGKFIGFDIAVNNPENTQPGTYVLKLRIVDKYGQPIANLEDIYVNFKKENSIIDFVNKFKDFNKQVKDKYNALDEADKDDFINEFMRLKEEEQNESKFIEIMQQYMPLNENIELGLYTNEEGKVVIEEREDKKVMYKVVGEDIDLRKVQIDETWKEVNERVELGELKWGDKVAIVAVDEEGKVVAGRVDRVGMGGIWTSKIEKTSEGYKAQIEGANIELPEGYSYKYVIADKLGRVEDGKWLIDEYYEQKMCPADAVEFTNREISFKEPKTLVMMIVDSNNNVCEVHETYLGYINVETDDERETFKVTEAMELPVGYSYGYYLYNEGDIWWDKEGKEFEEVKELEVGKEISSEGKDNVAIYIIKDGKIVRNLGGYRVNDFYRIEAWLYVNREGKVGIEERENRKVMYKVVDVEVDIKKVQIDETWKEVDERVELGELKWGDKVAIVAVDGEGKVVAGRVDRVDMGGIWTREVEKTGTGYKAQIEGASAKLPEGYSYKYILVDQLEREADGRWIGEKYIDKVAPKEAKELVREIEFSKPQTMLVMVVDKDGIVRDVSETLLNYIRVNTDMSKGTFKLEEAATLPEGYSYGYYLRNEGEWWQEEGTKFDGGIIKVGEEISAQGKDDVVVCIVKDGKIVRNLIGYRVNIPRIIDAQLIYNDNNFIEANINEGEIVLDLTNLNDTDVIKEISLNSTKVKEVRINLGNEQFILDMYNGNNVFTPAQLGLDPQNDGVKIGTLRNALNILNESGVLESGDMLVLDAELIDIYDNVVKEISIVIKVNN